MPGSDIKRAGLKVTLPRLKVLEVLEESGDADLLVTSYALLRIDIEHYRKREFEVVVLDEAQRACAAYLRRHPDARFEELEERFFAERSAISGKAISSLEAPEEIVIPLAQHIGLGRDAKILRLEIDWPAAGRRPGAGRLAG